MKTHNPKNDEYSTTDPFGALKATLSDLEIADAANSLLSLTVDDLQPYRFELKILVTIALGEMATDSGLSRKELETALGLPPATAYRHLFEGIISPIITTSKPTWRDRFHNKRNRLFSLIRPSNNPRFDRNDREEIERLEDAIISIISSERLFSIFLKEIGTGLSKPVVLDNVLDNLAWINSVLHEAYQGVMKIPNIEQQAGQRLFPVRPVLWAMKLLFEDGRYSGRGKAALRAYSFFLQTRIGPPPEFEGKKEINIFVDKLKDPYSNKFTRKRR